MEVGETLNEKSEAIDSLIKTYIREGRLFEAANAIREGVSKKVINSLVKALLEKAMKDPNPYAELYVAIKVAKLGAPIETNESLIKTCIKIKEWGLVIEAAEKLKVSERMIDKLVRTFIQIRELRRPLIWGVIEIAKLGASAETIDSLIKECLRCGFLRNAQEASVKLRRRSLSIEEVEFLIELAVETGWVDKAIEAAELRGRNLTPEEIDYLIRHQVQAGDLSEAIKAAKLAKRNLWAREIDEIVEVCLKKGKALEAIKAAAFGKRGFTEEEVQRLAEIVKGHYLGKFY
jgi:SOS response regulatory protein OraA/RecX